jgi:hypothetical protein
VGPDRVRAGGVQGHDLAVVLVKGVEIGASAGNKIAHPFLIRRMAVDYDIPLFTNIKVAREFIDALAETSETGLEIKAWEEYGGYTSSPAGT